MFGKRLKDLREDKDLKQKDLAEIIGVSDRTIGMYEQERREPDFKTLNKLADFFNVTTDFLLGKTDVKKHVESLKENSHVDEQTLKEFFNNLQPKEQIANITEFSKLIEEKLKKANLYNENMTYDEKIELANKILDIYKIIQSK